MADSSDESSPAADAGVDRRAFFSTSSLAMAGGLVAGYGTFFVMAGRYLYPSGDSLKTWMFVTELRAMRPGEAIEYEAPTGAKIVLTRTGAAGSADDFIALSSTCPHLGCQVVWQPQNDRFFCPCHNGVFNPEGMGVGGPPEGQSLPRYRLMVEGGLLFIEVPTEVLVDPKERGLADAAGAASMTA